MTDEADTILGRNQPAPKPEVVVPLVSVPLDVIAKLVRKLLERLRC